MIPPGNLALSKATGTISPSLTFLAPVHICTVLPSPTSTWQTTNFSAFGCESIFNIFPTTTFSIPSPKNSTVSVFVPVIVIMSANSTVSISIST